MLDKQTYDNLVKFLNREVRYYLRLVVVINDLESGDIEVAYIRDDVEAEYTSEQELADVISQVMFDDLTGYYNIARSWDSLIFQFQDCDGHYVLVSFDPEVPEYTNVIAISDQCHVFLSGNDLEIQPRHPLPNETDPLPDRQS